MRTDSSATGPSRRALLKFGAGAGLLIPSAGGMTLLLSGCGSDDEGAASSDRGKGAGTVKGAYMTALGLSLSFVETMVAKEQGFFENRGLDLKIQGGQGTATAIQAVLGGSADLTRANGINAIIAVAKSQAPLTSIATVRQESQFEVVSLPGKPVLSPKDLEGKTCGIVSAGGATENLLDVMLRQVGVDPKSVKRPVSGVGTAAYELAKNGAVDAWICVNTDRATIQREIGEVVFFSTDKFATMPSDSYNTTLQMVESDSDMPVRFLAGVLDAITFASDQKNWPTVVNNLLKYNPEADRAQSLAELPLLVQSWNAAGKENVLRLDEDVWGKGQEGLKKAGLITSTVGVDKLIYPKYLEEARKL